MEKSIFKSYTKYVSLNILGMIGLSCYILADTYYIAKALGATGIAALNFSIPIYSLIHGLGLMIGIGGATKYTILKSQMKDKTANIVFSHSIGLGALIGVILAIIGILGSTSLAYTLGADPSTLPLTKTYLTTILCFAPFFIINNIMLAFVRNDHNPNLSMQAMLAGSFSNIVLDYAFMFPLHMGMFGAAFATGFAPIISLGVLSIHFTQKKNRIQMIRCRIQGSFLRDIFGLGLSALISEVSNAVVLITFNLVILQLEGNIGVASYGIIANIALVGISVFTGIAQGIQPLISKGYGRKNNEVLKKVLRYAILTSIMIAVITYILTYLNSDLMIALFNSDKNAEIGQLAKNGLRIYFMGFLFAGFNIIIAMYLSATEQATNAFIISILRGCIIIVPMVLLFSQLWKMTGVWFSFVLTEGIVTMIAFYIMGRRKINNE
ncbi:MAG: multi antimicrobial extrusion protein MatE [Herbinix sp.]|jgi:putative MATE family efflux protein|nr:multi antimicrobial extrusion protein MatE [Herbinix sp.]